MSAGKAALTKSLPWVGVLAAALLLVNANVLGARWYKRYDFTSDKLYTLSAPTRELLRGLNRPLDVVVLLGNADPLTVSVRHMLEAYSAETRQLRVRYVDPDRSPAEFLAAQQKYQLLAGKAEDGRIITDASIVVADESGRHWFVTADELVHVDEDSGRSRPALEQALSSALANVRKSEKAKLCFTTGHREPTLEDQGPQGLSELKQRLLKNNYEPVSLDLSAPAASLQGCHAVVMAGPELEVGAAASERLQRYVTTGGNAVLLLQPSMAEANDVRPSGLEPLLLQAGITLGRDVVLESDSEHRLPQGRGEVFFAQLKPHAVTRGILHDDDKLSSRVLVVLSRSLGVEQGASSVLETTERGHSLRNLAAFSGHADNLGDNSPSRRLSLAAARELPKPAGSTAPHGPRLFVSGASNLAWNRNFQDPALYGNRRLIENAISWVAARPTMISVAEKPERELGLSLSEESLGEVLRYVLLYMPASAGLIGAFVLLRRRNIERRTRSGDEARKPS